MIRTWPKGRQQLFFLRDFEFLKPGGERYAIATSAWLLMDGFTRRMLLPQTLPTKMPDNGGMSALSERLDQIGPNVLATKKTVSVGYSDVDMVGHVNASRYIDWISNCIPREIYQKKQLDWLQINYMSEARWGEELQISSGIDRRDENLWHFEGESSSRRKVAFRATWQWKPTTLS